MGAGARWAALNVGTDSCVQRNPAVWDHQRTVYRGAGMPYGPWMHCRSVADVEWLIGVAESWGDCAFIGCNVEDVFNDKLSLQELGGVLLDFWVNKYSKPVHMATLPWVQNAQGWQYVDFAYLALEMFPLEGGQPYLDNWQGCVDHAFQEGAKKVTLLFSTTTPRTAYPDVAHCLYTADDITNWSAWKDAVPQPPGKPSTPPTPPEVPMLTAKQYPYTGPCYGPGTKQTTNYSTVKGLKRAMIRLGYLAGELGKETDDYGSALKAAMKKFQRSENLTQDGNYDRSEYAELRYRKLKTGPHAGEYALDALALKYVREDVLTLCYPHPDIMGTYVGQGLHQTTGIYGNWAIDFMAHGGTPVLAVERMTIVRFSGHDPSLSPSNGAGIWGWSIYATTASGYNYFATHMNARTCKPGDVVEVGDQIGIVGHWPGDEGRSHTHLGCSSVRGVADAKAHITAISKAPKLPDL